jgi:hypothetical protein
LESEADIVVVADEEPDADGLVDETEEDGDDCEDELEAGVLAVDVVVLLVPPLSTWNSRTWAMNGFSTVPSEPVMVGVDLGIVTSQMLPFCTDEPPSVAPIELHIEVGTIAASCGERSESAVAAPPLG